MSSSNRRRNLRSSVCLAALVLGTNAAYAESSLPASAEVTGPASIAHTQTYKDFLLDAPSIVAGVGSTLDIDFDAIVDAVARIGGRDTGDRNITTATGYANEASLSISSNLNTDAGLLRAGAEVIQGLSELGSLATSNGVTALADMAIGLAQTTTDAAGGLANETTMVINAEEDVEDSTLSIYGNMAEAMGVLNRATSSIDITVNDTNSTAAIALGQMATDSDLQVDNDATFKIELDEDVEGSLVELDGNTARAVAVANIATNTMDVTGNTIAAQPADIEYYAAESGWYEESVSGGSSDTYALATYSVANGQALQGTGNEGLFDESLYDLLEDLVWGEAPYAMADVQAVLSSDGNLTFDMDFGDDVRDSTISMSGNRALASARGNDATNAATLEANSITGSEGFFGGEDIDLLEGLYAGSRFTMTSGAEPEDYSYDLVPINGVDFYEYVGAGEGDYYWDSNDPLVFASDWRDGLDPSKTYYDDSGIPVLMGMGADYTKVAPGVFIYTQGTGEWMFEGTPTEIDFDLFWEEGEGGESLGVTGNVVALSNNQSVVAQWIAARAGDAAVSGGTPGTDPAPFNVDWFIDGAKKFLDAEDTDALTDAQIAVLLAMGYQWDGEAGEGEGAYWAYAAPGDISGTVSLETEGEWEIEPAYLTQNLHYEVWWDEGPDLLFLKITIDPDNLTEAEIAWLDGQDFELMAGNYQKVVSSPDYENTETGTYLEEGELLFAGEGWMDGEEFDAYWTMTDGRKVIGGLNFTVLTDAQKAVLLAIGYELDQGGLSMSLPATLASSGILDATVPGNSIWNDDENGALLNIPYIVTNTSAGFVRLIQAVDISTWMDAHAETYPERAAALSAYLADGWTYDAAFQVYYRAAEPGDAYGTSGQEYYHGASDPISFSAPWMRVNDLMVIPSDYALALTEAQVEALLAQGWERGEDNSLSKSIHGGDTKGTLTGVVPGIAGELGSRGPKGILLSVEDDVRDSSLAVDLNAIGVQATGNTATNTIAATSNLIGGMDDNWSADATLLLGELGMEGSADAAFAINSNQLLMNSVVTASLDEISSEDDLPVSMEILLSVGDDVKDSTVSASGNSLSAVAVGNQINGGAGNSITLSGAEVETTSAIANVQNSVSAAVAASAVLGRTEGAVPAVPGTPGTDDEDFLAFWTIEDIGGVPHKFIDMAGLTPAQIDELQNLGYEEDEGYLVAAVADGDLMGTVEVEGEFWFEVPWEKSGGSNIIDASEIDKLNEEQKAMLELDGWLAEDTGHGIIYWKASGAASKGTAKFHWPDFTVNWTMDEDDHKVIAADVVDTLREDQIEALVLLGYQLDADGNLWAEDGEGDISGVAGATIPGSPGSNGSEGDDGYFIPTGVLVQIGDDVRDSTIRVEDNAISASATVNTAINRTAVLDVNTLAGLTGEAASVDTGTGSTYADHVVANGQSAVDVQVTAYAEGMFGIVTADPDSESTRVKDSTLSVSGNGMAATGTVNSAANSLALEGNEVSATAAVTNDQIAGFGLYADVYSEMNVVAPMAARDSTISLDDNVNTASVVVNTATNAMMVDATDLDTFDDESVADLMSVHVMDDGIYGEMVADYLVANTQSAAGAIYATADSWIGNWEEFVRGVDGEEYREDPSSPLSDSLISITGNVTQSDVAMNRATNSLSLTSASEMTVTAGIGNLQSSEGYASAWAGSSIGPDVWSVDGPGVVGSTISVSKNVTKASASSNVASNALNVESGWQGGYGEPSVDVWGGAGGNVMAGYAILNSQVNEAGVSATAVMTAGLSAFGEGPDAIYLSVLNVAGNTVAASAVGNSVINALSIGALDLGGSSAAVFSNQVNTGDISALVSHGNGGDFVIYGLGDNLGSSVAKISGNSAVASATGNRAVSSITRTGNSGGFSFDDDSIPPPP